MAAKTTKHDPRRCTTCRDYARHEVRQNPVGNLWKKLGTVHLVDRGSIKVTACGRRRRPGMLWTLARKLATCGTCKRAAGLGRKLSAGR